MQSPVLRSAKKLRQLLKHVTINSEAVTEFANTIQTQRASLAEALFRQTLTLEQAWETVLVFNTVNFCYWALPGKKKWSISIDDVELDGSVALFRLLEKQMMQYGTLRHLTDFSILKNLLNSDPEIPILRDRYLNIVNLYQNIDDKYDRNPTKLLGKSHNCAVQMLNNLVNNFDCYQDSSSFAGTDVHFWKRAQLNAKMWHDYLVSTGRTGLQNIHKLTAFADYKVPQLLRHLGILEYDDELASKVNSYAVLLKDSVLENEIRIATILAIEKIAQKAQSITACEIDNLLWSRATTNKDKMLPYHRTVTSAY